MPTPVLVNNASGVVATAIFVRQGPCNVTAYQVSNPTTGAGYVQFYDTALAPTVGTTQPNWIAYAPTTASTSLAFSVPGGLYFQNGLWIAATTGPLTGAPGTALQVSLAMS